MIIYPNFDYKYSWKITYEEEQKTYYAFCQSLNCGVYSNDLLDLYFEIKQATEDLIDLDDLCGETGNQYLISLI